MSPEVANTSPTLLAAIVESSHDAIISTKLDGLVTFWSPAAERMFGYTSTEVIGRPIFAIIPPSLVDKERALISRLAENGRMVRNESIRMRKGGQQLKVAATFSPVRDGAGTIVEILSIAHDVTEAQPGNLVRRESEDRFRDIADSTPVMIKSAGVDGELDYVNKAFLEFTGRRIDETLGIGWAEDIHPEDLQSCFEFRITAFCQRRLFQHEYRLRRHDGEYRWIVDTDVPRFDADGKFIGYMGLKRRLGGVPALRRKASKPTFVELTEPHAAPLAEYAIDLECPSGRKMRIQWKASGPPDWVSLLRAWREMEG